MWRTSEYGIRGTDTNDDIYQMAYTPPEPKQTIELILDGVSRAITKEQLVTLAAQGRITPDTPVSVNGAFMTAGNVQGIAFGQSTPQSTSSGRQTSAPPTMTVFLYGVEQVITTEQLHNLAARGIIGPDTPINVNGKLAPAGKAKGIVFGQPQNTAGQMLHPPVSPVPLNSKQRFIPAIIAGVIAAGLCAILWGIISAVTGYQIGYMALGVGFVVGISIQMFGKGNTSIYGIFGAGLSLIACVIGNLISACAIFANSPEVSEEGFSTVFLLFTCFINPLMALEVLQETFTPIDLLFYGLALTIGYKTSFTSDSENDSNQNFTEELEKTSKEPEIDEPSNWKAIPKEAFMWDAVPSQGGNRITKLIIVLACFCLAIGIMTTIGSWKDGAGEALGMGIFISLFFFLFMGLPIIGIMYAGSLSKDDREKLWKRTGVLGWTMKCVLLPLYFFYSILWGLMFLISLPARLYDYVKKKNKYVGSVLDILESLLKK